ncbi:MAG: S8 family serine peptidase [Planctomycetota bacterium]|nr:S8 family serine peptidase [Planctomycetota bacterium]MDG1984932.1 S8 family serine peptidase [Planctomycetota bacterium]
MNSLFTLLLPAAALLAAPLAHAQEAPTVNAFVEFAEVDGQLEFSGVMCARPLQVSSAAERGQTPDEARRLQAIARKALEAYELKKYVGATDEYLFFVPAGETETSIANDLLATGAFQYVEPDWTVYPIGCPNDSQFGQQWHHQANRMASCAAWDLETGDPAIVVAICDTGILLSHADLQLHRQEGYHSPTNTWEGQGGPIADVNGHGTLCVGTSAANGDNGIGVSGVGWNLGHRTMRVTDAANGGASLSNITQAARAAAEVGDKVSSCSYSGVTSASVNSTGTYIRGLGALLVWAAGNSSDVLSGNRDDDVIVVGATTSTDALASFSNRGSLVDLAAPGASIRTTNDGGGYSNVSGTSFACPMVAGLCGLIWSRNPSLSPQEVEDVLRMSCDDLGAAGIDDTFGHGRINSDLAMQMTPATSVSISFPVARPDEVSPAGGDELDVVVAPGNDAADTAAALVWFDTGAGFVSQPLPFIGSDTFRATFPAAACPSVIDYYFEFPLVSGATAFAPPSGAVGAYSAEAVDRAVLLADDLEAASGWTAGAPGDTATTGIWTLVDPIGTAAQPEDDHTLGGSQCFVTGQGSPGGSLGENDVDGGLTTLISPPIDVSVSLDPYIGYWRWYNNSAGSNTDDTFTVDVSADGGANWVNVETLGPAAQAGGWARTTFRVSDLVATTGSVQLRFVAEDSGGGSIVEAAIDDLEVFELCPANCGFASYCTSSANSSGLSAVMVGTGSTSIGANDLLLVAAGCPGGTIGIFAYAPDRGSSPVGNGTLCLGSVIRLGVASADFFGTASLPFDNTALPNPSGQVSVGETWNFQFVYRDLAAGGAFFNLTDGLAVTFCP